ncbi:MAG TPA: DUF4434 domain-containing protein, partial [Opitutaceae bacterium]|nr:DUF4434 domain-containing protein [Opitutaceae bacterium]
AQAVDNPPNTPSPIWNRYWMGVSYYPEQWTPERWEEDFRKMHELGFNIVRMGEFAWSSFESAPGKFHFDWMDKAIESAQRHGISVVLGTPTAAVPPWLHQQHPDVLGANERGAFNYGGRKGFSIDSPAMQAAAERIVTALSRHYGKNPAVIGWQISNEPGFPFMNFDQHALSAFRIWLNRRYGTIDQLNRARGGTFWSNNYGTWNEIEFPLNTAEGGWRPGSRLDYRRFFSDSFIRWLKFEGDILRRNTRNQFIFTNWPDTRWSVDTFQAASVIDFSAWDNYSAMPGPGDYHSQFYAGMNHDLSRCSHPNQRFMIAEQVTQAPTNSDPRAVRLQTYIDFAHGSSGTIFFEWRPPITGNEQGYVSVLQLDGSYGPSESQFQQMHSEFDQLGPLLANAVTDSDLGMIFSYDNQWDQGFWDGNTFRGESGFDIEFQRFYNGLKRLRRNIDVVSPEAPLNRYRMLVVPGLQMISDEFAGRLMSYVKQGGILVVNPKTGTREADGHLRELLAPGVFADAAGIRIPSKGILRNVTDTYQITFSPDDHGFTVATTMEGIELHGADVLATFHGRGLEGKPAITLNHFGKGFMVYLGGDSRDQHFHDKLFSLLADHFQIPPLLNVPEGVEVVSRKGNQHEYLFLLNLTGDTQSIDLPKSYDEMISRKQISGNLTLPPFDVAVLRL